MIPVHVSPTSLLRKKVGEVKDGERFYIDGNINFKQVTNPDSKNQISGAIYPLTIFRCMNLPNRQSQFKFATKL